MTTLPVTILLGAAVALGTFLGLLYIRRIRRKPVLIGTHLLLGAGGLEQLVIMFRGTPSGEAVPVGSLGNWAAALLLVTMLSGLAAALLPAPTRRVVNVALATHAGIGIAGFVLFLVWASNL